jgi:hypothetical protein
LMGLVPRFGLIIASTTSPSILYLMHWKSQLLQCT